MEIDPLRDLARTARKLPGYRKLRRTLVPRIRRNAIARTVANRLFATSGARPQGALLTAGSLLGGIGSERLPVVLIVIDDTTEARCHTVVEQVAVAQLLGAAFKPLFVLDAPLFAPFRRYGYAVDLMIPRSAWSSTEQSWEVYAGQRLTQLMRIFAAAATLRCGEHGLAGADQQLLIALGGAAPPTARRDDSD